MLVVRHYVARSKIHNLGLYLGEAVSRGKVIWRYEPEFDVEFSADMVEALPTLQKRVILDCAEYFPDRGVYRLGNDGDIFMNHSDRPNLIDLGDVMIAARAIAAGEELTCDYGVVHVAGYRPEPATSRRAASP